MDAAIFSNQNHRVKLLEGIFQGKGYFIKMGLCNQTIHLAKLKAKELYPGKRILVPTQMTDEAVLTSCPVECQQLAMMAGFVDTQPLEVWHMRLGHLNQTAIQQLTTRATGLLIRSARPQTLTMKCESCLRGAQHKNISYSRGRRATKKL